MSDSTLLPSGPALRSSGGNDALETIYVGGGCFWCTEAVFDRVRGVMDVQSGYANGHVPNPTYEQICTGETGHAEVIRLRFDPREIGLEQVLEIFFQTHDPTTLNRQGNDVGTQYRSAIYTEVESQLIAARAVRDRLEAAGVFGAPIVTEVELLRSYWPAEDYHQDYFRANPHQGYCAWIVRPKVDKFVHRFGDWLKAG